ncbi:MAG: cation:proton antiporter [Ilumatobacteraceae bacterium]
MHSDVALVIAGVLAAGLVAQILGWRLRVPAIVFLLAFGLLAGPVTDLVHPDDVFGDALFPTVSIAVAIILFEGSLAMGVAGIRTAGRTTITLLTVGSVITFAGVAVAARFVLDVEWRVAYLLAAVLVVTGPTVIGPIVKSLGLHGRLGMILEAEGTIIDPIGAIATVVVFQSFFESSDSSVAETLLTTFGIGVGAGLIGTAILVFVLWRLLIPDELHQVLTLTVVVSTFAVSNHYAHEAGLVAVTVLGFLLASQKRVSVRHILDFNETLRVLFISGLFILLAARIDRATLTDLEWRSILFLIVLVVIVRPVSVAGATIGVGLTRAERIFLAATAPRGIVAASIASVFALRLSEEGVPGAQIVLSATFTVIVGTVLLSGLGARPLARRLGLLGDDGAHVVIVGSNDFTMALAEVLGREGVSSLLVDADRLSSQRARMRGLDSWSGSIFSGQDVHEVGLDRASVFLAATSNDELNALACRMAAETLERRHVFQLPPSRPSDSEIGRISLGLFGRSAFSMEATAERLDDLLLEGWKVSATNITKEFSVRDWQEQHADGVPLAVIDGKRHLHVLAAGRRRSVRGGERLVALVPPREE